MARITIEDALIQGKNRFALVHLSALRAKQLLKGANPVADVRNNREIVAALREIAAGKIKYANPEFLNGSKEDFLPLGQDDATEFVGDEEYSE